MSCDLEDHITSHYEIKRRIGKGAYGIVWKSIDRKTGEIIALKKIFDAFTNPTDAQRTYREIMFLQEFSSHDNVIQLLNVIRAQNDQDIYLVFEFMDTDLHAVIKARILQPIHIQYIMYQLFKVMKYIHSGNCIHRDLKPSNILLNSECFIKLADFGLARSLVDLPRKNSDCTFNPAMTDYVATRWYRAPEILLGSVKYTKGVDIWSLGCILAEMVAGKALFPGTSTINQIDKILSTVPTPNRTDIESIKSPYAHCVLDRLLRKRRVPLTDILPTATNDALDLISKLLQFNPGKRISALQSLRHPFVAKFQNPQDEPELDYNVVPYLDDNTQLSIKEYRDKLYESIVQRGQQLMEAREHLENHYHEKTTTEAVRPKDLETTKQQPVTTTSDHIRDKQLSVSKPHSCSTIHEKSESPVTSNQSTHSRTSPMVRNTSAPVCRGSLGTHGKQESLRGYQGQPQRPTHIQQQGAMYQTTLSHSQIGVPMKEQQRVSSHGSPQRHKQSNDHQLVVTSARIIPSTRPSRTASKVSKAVPSRIASGTYTQTHGVITKSNLARLKANKW